MTGNGLSPMHTSEDSTLIWIKRIQTSTLRKRSRRGHLPRVKLLQGAATLWHLRFASAPLINK